MEAVIVLLLGTLLLLAAAAPFMAFVALLRVSRLEKQLQELRDRLAGVPSPRAAPPPPEPEVLAAAPPGPRSPEPPAPEPSAPSPPQVPVQLPEPGPSPGVAPPVVSRPPRPARGAASADFATNLGPKILIGAGGLAVVVFLALFVRYAWENDWVGPTGRVLNGSLVSLALVAGGLRLLRGVYAPLGQGLAAAGFAGLYVSAYAAHGFYDLVPRGVSTGVMLAVTVCAVAVADRLGTRLLAILAWTGGYLTPVLMSTGEDRAIALFAYLLLLGAGAVWLDRRKPWPETLPLAFIGTLLLYGGWYASHFRPERFEVAAGGLVLFTALFVFGAPARTPAPLFPVAALAAGGAAAIEMAGRTDRPVALLVLLVVQGGLAVWVRRRWEWAEAMGAILGTLAVLAWSDAFFDAGRVGDLLTLGLALAAVCSGVLVVRGLALRERLGRGDGLTQIVAAGLAWLVLDRALGLADPRLLGPAAAGLAALHLALGLAARRQKGQSAWARVPLALAAVFLTIAIPVQLGLFGITLAWAGEALVLLWLGVRQQSLLARVGGCGVLVLAVGRLFVRHLPLHEGAFTPAFNPVFGTWLLVIVAVALARRIVARVGERGTGFDRVAMMVLGPLGICLLFGLLTAETREFFGERVRTARAAGDTEAVLVARRQGDLALSVLWTLFATGLLASGLALRSRALFHTAYALFGITALKVVMVDLATLPTLYRMLSFLALGVLLLAGAWLNIRFRERLMTPGEDGA